MQDAIEREKFITRDCLTIEKNIMIKQYKKQITYQVRHVLYFLSKKKKLLEFNF